MTRPEEPHGDRPTPPPADPWATIDRPVPTVYLGNPDTTADAGPSAPLPGPHPGERAHPAAPTVHGPSTAPTPTLYQGSPDPTVYRGSPEPTVYGGETAPTIHRSEAAPTVYGGETAPTIHRSETGPTVYGGETAPTVRQAPPGPAVHRAETAPTVYQGSSNPTVYQGSPDTAAHRGEPVPTVRLGDSSPTVRAPGEVRFGPGVPVAPVPAPAWPATATPRRPRPLWRRLVSLLSGLLTVVLVVLVGYYIWQRLSPLAVESVTVAVPEQAGNRCDVTVDVVATVRTNGRSGVIRYQWFRSDASPGVVLTEQVGRGQTTATLTLKWTFSGVGTATETATVNITEPSPIQAGTQVTYRCGRG